MLKCFFPVTFAEDVDGVADQSSLNYLLGFSLSVDLQDTPEGQESIKAKLNAIRNKLVQQVRDEHRLDERHRIHCFCLFHKSVSLKKEKAFVVLQKALMLLSACDKTSILLRPLWRLVFFFLSKRGKSNKSFCRELKPRRLKTEG